MNFGDHERIVRYTDSVTLFSNTLQTADNRSRLEAVTK